MLDDAAGGQVRAIGRKLSLSARQRQVVTRVHEGKIDKTIAFELGLTMGTLKGYMNTIYRKLHVDTENKRVTLALMVERELRDRS